MHEPESHHTQLLEPSPEPSSPGSGFLPGVPIIHVEQLLAVVGHDLRSPLTAIAAAAGALRHLPLGEREHRLAENILTSSLRMGRMVEQLLDYTRVRRGELEVEPRSMDLHALVRRVVEELEPSFPHVRVQLDLQGDGWGTWDPDRLAEVLSNLLMNAVQHGGTAQVDVAVLDRGTEVCLCVHNFGACIAADLLPHLFEPFRRSRRQPGPRGGLGLGLYIAHAFAQAHGGCIQVESSPADGTTFRVRLPRHAEWAGTDHS